MIRSPRIVAARPLVPALAASCALLLVSACVSRVPAPPAPTPPSPRPPIAAPITPDRAAAARFERIEFSALPALADADLISAWPAWLASCRVLARGNGTRAAVWTSVCAAAALVETRDAGAIRSYLAGHFDAWRIDPLDASGVPTRGRQTGYYEPELVGSRERRGAFTVPLARPPADLLSIELGPAVPEAAGTRLRGRLVDDGSRKRVVPYWTREELTNGNRLNGLEILWVEDPIEAFFLQVQGSGRVRLVGGRDDGAVIRVGYADTNGHAYRSIGRWLIERGELPLDEASMQGIQTWARANPKRIPELLNQNPSYVFFRELPLGDPNAGPLGALAAPLTAGYSAAVDPSFTPLGAPIVINSTHPGTRAPLTRLAIAQDTGSAIRGPARIDLFWGTGRAAGELAGKSRDDVTVWMLLPKGQVPGG